MCNDGGFTLIEAVVAIVVGVAVVVGVGALSERLVHHRVTTDSNSAAMSLAERQIEKLLADPTPRPTNCTPFTNSDLCAGGTHTTSLNADGTTTNPQYAVSWIVVD